VTIRTTYGNKTFGEDSGLSRVSVWRIAGIRYPDFVLLHLDRHLLTVI